MSPSMFNPSAATEAPLPPLPDLSAAASAPSGGPDSTQAPGFLASLMSTIGPVKSSVDAINAASQQIAQLMPETEPIVRQIVALASQLLPMAAQMAMQPMGASGGGAGGPMPPPPGGPQPILSPQG